MSNESKIFIQKYSDKSFVVRGDTQEYKDSLKNLGGKWNSRLTDKNTGEKFGAWLYWSNKRSELDKWFFENCPKVNVENNNLDGYDSPNKIDKQETRIKNLEYKVEKISKLLGVLEQLCKSQNFNTSVDEEQKREVLSDDEPSPTVKPKRLLRRKIKNN